MRERERERRKSEINWCRKFKVGSHISRECIQIAKLAASDEDTFFSMVACVGCLMRYMKGKGKRMRKSKFIAEERLRSCEFFFPIFTIESKSHFKVAFARARE